MSNKAKYKYYAVAIGNVANATIYNRWLDCKKVVIGYDSTYKSFHDLQDAVNFIFDVLGETKIILDLSQAENLRRIERTKKGK